MTTKQIIFVPGKNPKPEETPHRRRSSGLLKQILRPMLADHDEVMLIGHGLGSVIAYDALWELSHEEGTGKTGFLTLGSPLGMHYINRRLLGMNGQGRKSYPDRIRRWINLSAEGDVVALNRNFNEVFHPMLELGLVESIEDHSHGIYNFFRTDQGLNSHRSYGYLVNPTAGSIIADWWKRHRCGVDELPSSRHVGRLCKLRFLADCYAKDSRNPSNASRWRGWRRAKIFNNRRSSGNIHS